MVNKELLKEKYNLSVDEYNAVCERVTELLNRDNFDGSVISKCDNTLNLTKNWLKKKLKTDTKIQNCIDFFERNGGFCECEILFNAEATVRKMKKEVEG